MCSHSDLRSLRFHAHLDEQTSAGRVLECGTRSSTNSVPHSRHWVRPQRSSASKGRSSKVSTLFMLAGIWLLFNALFALVALLSIVICDYSKNHHRRPLTSSLG